MLRKLTCIALSSCLLFLGVPAFAFAEQADSLAPATFENEVGASSEDLEPEKMFVMFDDPISSLSVGRAVSELGENGMPVTGVESFDHNVFLLEFDKKADGDDSPGSVGVAQDVVEEAAPRCETAPVKKSRLFKFNEAKNPEHVYQLEYLSLFEKSNSINEFNNGHGFEKMRALASKTGRKATVAVIDSGFRASHVELKGKLIEKYAYDAIKNRVGTIGKDVADHGTGVASIIVGNKDNGYGGYGICANTNVLPIKAANDKGELYDSDILESLQHIESVVKSGQVKNLKVVNMSFGCWYSAAQKKEYGLGNVKTDPIYAQIKRLHDVYGITCVCAGGNGNDEGDPNVGGFNFPSDYDCCVAVHGAYDNVSNAYYADVNAHKDISALVWGEVASASDDYSLDSAEGTSFSSPYVAAAIVSLMQINPKLTPDAALKLLQKTAVKVTKSRFCNYSAKNGSAGVMNAEKAAWLALGKAKRGKYYWTGMSDARKIGKLTFGFKVLSSKNATVALTNVLGYDGNLSTVSLPNAVKLGDGRTYRVTENRMVAFELFGKVKNVVSPANTAAFGFGALVPTGVGEGLTGQGQVLPCVTFKSKKLTAKRVRDCLDCDGLTVKKVVVNVSKNHRVNVKYADKYRKFLTKKNCGAKIGKVVAA